MSRNTNSGSADPSGLRQLTFALGVSFSVAMGFVGVARESLIAGIIAIILTAVAFGGLVTAASRLSSIA